MRLRQSPALYQNTYVWLVFVSALDIMMTWVVLHLGGREVNGLADAVIRRFDLPGLVLFKFAFIILVIGICEIVGRRNDVLGRRLAEGSVAITCVPVLLAFLLILIHG